MIAEKSLWEEGQRRDVDGMRNDAWPQPSGRSQNEEAEEESGCAAQPGSEGRNRYADENDLPQSSHLGQSGRRSQCSPCPGIHASKRRGLASGGVRGVIRSSASWLVLPVWRGRDGSCPFSPVLDQRPVCEGSMHCGADMDRAFLDASAMKIERRILDEGGMRIRKRGSRVGRPRKSA